MLRVVHAKSKRGAPTRTTGSGGSGLGLVSSVPAPGCARAGALCTASALGCPALLRLSRLRKPCWAPPSWQRRHRRRGSLGSMEQGRRLRGQHGHPAPRAQARNHLLRARQLAKTVRFCISAARSLSQQAWRLAWAGTRSVGFPPSPPTATVARTCVITLRCAFFLCEERLGLDPRRHSSAGHRT